MRRLVGGVTALVALAACSSGATEAQREATTTAVTTITTDTGIPTTTTTLPSREAAARQILAPVACGEAPDAATGCFALSVRANRGSDGAPRFMTLPVMVLPAETEPAAGAVVILPTGPGRATLPEADTWSTHPLRATHDLVLVDQRGTGAATPSFDCPEIDQEVRRGLTVHDPDNERAARTEAIFVCQARLGDEGADTADVTSSAIAADLEVLRGELGYADWSLYASANPDPILDGLRTVEAAVALGHPIASVIHDRRGLAEVPAALAAVRAQYDAAPWSGTVDLGSGPAPLVIAGDDIEAAARITLGSPALQPSVPEALANLAAGNTALLPIYAQLLLTDAATNAEAAELSVRCSNTVPVDERCAEWGVTGAATPPSTAQPPTLVVTGSCLAASIVRWLDEPANATC